MLSPVQMAQLRALGAELLHNASNKVQISFSERISRADVALSIIESCSHRKADGYEIEQAGRKLIVTIQFAK